jgi:biotin transport system substrate-specific component
MMKDRRRNDISAHLILSALFTALICAGSYIALPLVFSPVPIVLQNMFVLLAAFLLGPKWGLVSILVFLMLGSLGFPVFSLGRGGAVHFIGPTGGYLLGYIPAVLIGGFVSAFLKGRKGALAVAAGLSLLSIYAVGVPWLKTVLGIPWKEALLIGMLPFLPGDLLKAAAAVLLTHSLRPLLRSFRLSADGCRRTAHD